MHNHRGPAKLPWENRKNGQIWWEHLIHTSYILLHDLSVESRPLSSLHVHPAELPNAESKAS